MKNILPIISFILLATFVSCKKCDPTNSTSGIIVEDAIIRVIGYEEGYNFITSPSEFEKLVEVSFDGGKNYKAVDFNKYSVFSLQTTALCSSGYKREVKIDNKNETVKYTIDIEECNSCTYLATINNWVLTKSVPSYYEESFVVNKR